jgi:subtilisin family serine protease
VAIAAALLAAVVAGTALAGESAPQAHRRRDPAVLFHAKERLTPAERELLHGVLGAFQVHTRRAIAAGAAEAAEFGEIPGLSRAQVAAMVQATGAVDFAEADERVPAAKLPNDPAYDIQWHHRTIGSPAAWDVTTGSTAIKVVVCDSGVETKHPDLARNLSLPGYDVATRSTNVSPHTYHGTMVAGVIGAIGNNGLLVTGEAWQARIVPVRITEDSGGLAYYSDMAECVTWAADHGAKVVNLSYRGGPSRTLDAAAKRLRARGGLLFVASGNDGCRLGSGTGACTERVPDFASFLLVGATDKQDRRARFSNYGKAIDLVAPGVEIATTYIGGRHALGDGTSFAAPLAAGVAALIYSVKPNFTPAQVEDILRASALDLGRAGRDAFYGYGRIDAGRALALARARR